MNQGLTLAGIALLFLSMSHLVAASSIVHIETVTFQAPRHIFAKLCGLLTYFFPSLCRRGTVPMRQANIRTSITYVVVQISTSAISLWSTSHKSSTSGPTMPQTSGPLLLSLSVCLFPHHDRSTNEIDLPGCVGPSSAGRSALSPPTCRRRPTTAVRALSLPRSGQC